MTRYARRTDASQREVIQALEACGLSVRDLSRAGNGCPDLAVSFRGTTAFVEAKSPDCSYGKRLRDSQANWLDGWQGEWACVHSAEEAIAWANAWKSQKRLSESHDSAV